MRVRRTAAIMIALISAAIGWLLLAPPALGGTAHFAIVRGTSMYPHVRAGDLVVVRPQLTYPVGAVVAYKSPDIGVVLHRVTAVQGDRLVVKGDNNSWTDSAEPRPPQVIGTMRLRIPKLGAFIAWARVPKHGIPLAAGAGLISIAGGAGTAKRRRRRRSTHAQAEGPASRAPDALASLRGAVVSGLLAGIIAAVTLAGIAFVRAPWRGVTQTRTYTQHVTFWYRANVRPSAAYPSGVVDEHQPVFAKLVSIVNASYRYSVVAQNLESVTGTARLVAVVSDGNGWTRQLPLAPSVPLVDHRVTQTAPLDFGAIKRMVAELSNETGVSRGSYTVQVVPVVDADATIAGRPIHIHSAEALTLGMDAIATRVVAPGTGADPFSTYKTGSFDVAHRAVNHVGVGRFRLSVHDARLYSLAAAGVLGLALLVLTGATVASKPESRIAARYGIRPTPVMSLPEGSPVDVVSLDALARIAATEQVPILHQKGDVYDQFAVVGTGAMYRWIAHE